MREIKFRGQKYNTREWVFGSLHDYSPIGRSIYVNENDSETTEGFQVYSDTVGQYTGKTTKINQEIYENDILQSPSGGLWIVKWSSSDDGWRCYQWKYEDFTGEKIWSIDDDRYPLGHSLSGLLTYDYKVIGSIYDYNTES